jgi:hypothetical protein
MAPLVIVYTFTSGSGGKDTQTDIVVGGHIAAPAPLRKETHLVLNGIVALVQSDRRKH